MKSTRVSPILFLGFAIIFLLSVAVYPVMAADTVKTQMDTFNITAIPALPGGSGENNPVNVTVSNTTEVMDPEDRTKVPGTGTGTEPSPSVAPEVTGTRATTQPVPKATTNVPVTGTESSPSVAPEVTGTSATTQPVPEATPPQFIPSVPLTVGSSPAVIGNIVAFGNPHGITIPDGTYESLGGDSAIRADGTLESFNPGTIQVPARTDYIAVTTGAAITEDGTMYRYNPKEGTQTYLPAETHKKYVAVSAFSNWLLTIYNDEAGDSHLEALANPASPPEVFNNVPTGTGWTGISAGHDYALALKSDGTLVAWGNNSQGQQDLPTTVKYKIVSASDEFSLGLSTDGTIYAAGSDSHGQVSGRPKGAGYADIAAGGAGLHAGFALTPIGTIYQWGNPIENVPKDAGYTDISCWMETVFALHERAPERHVTGPISPGQRLLSREGTEEIVPLGSIIDHNHNDMARILFPNGTEYFWVNDAGSDKVKFPLGAVLPVSLVHYIPSGSIVDAKTDYRATVSSSPGANAGDVMTVKENAWYDEVNPTLPRAMCFADTGCSAGVTAKQQLFLSAPLPRSNGGIPVFSVHQVSNTSWVGTISTLGSTNAEESRSIVMDKVNVNPDQAINFSVISGNWGNESGTNVVMSAKANLTSENAVMKYTGTATASRQLATFTLTPKIWRQEPTGDVLVYSSNPKTCTDSNECRLEGAFVPLWDISNVTGTFSGNVTTIYTLPHDATANSGVPEKIATIYPLTTNEPVPEVIVTGPLSPLEPGKLMDAANVNNTVPWGGTIEHVMDGDVPMTVVYDDRGQPQFRADDRMATNISVPNGNFLPVTHIYTLPSTTIINQMSDEQTDTVNSLTGDKYFSVFNKEGVARNSINNAVYPTIFCKNGFGCSIADLSEIDMYVAQPFTKSIDYIPMGFLDPLDNNTWKSTMCRTTSSDLHNCSTSEKITLVTHPTDNFAFPPSDITEPEGLVTFPVKVFGWGKINIESRRYAAKYVFFSEVWWAATDLSTVPTVEVQTYLEKKTDSGGDYAVFVGPKKTFTNVGLIPKKDEHEYTVLNSGCYFVTSWSHWVFAPGWEPAEGVYVGNSSGLCYNP